MKYRKRNLFSSLLLVIVLQLSLAASTVADDTPADYTTHHMRGWTIHVHQQLVKKDAKAVEDALKLMDKQLQIVTDRVPTGHVKILRTVPVWFSPVYDGFRPTGEYHPNKNWLIEHGRRKELAKCIEFSNIHIFEKEIKRMPVMVIHELAHAYHDQVLSFDHPEIIAAYRAAKANKKYEKVKRNNGKTEKSYALVNHKEYFAECTEAFFGRNDFYPFNKEELADFDPLMSRLLTKIWAGKKDK